MDKLYKKLSTFKNGKLKRRKIKSKHRNFLT